MMDVQLSTHEIVFAHCYCTVACDNTFIIGNLINVVHCRRVEDVEGLASLTRTTMAAKKRKAAKKATKKVARKAAKKTTKRKAAKRR